MKTDVANAIRTITAAAQTAYDQGQRSAMIDLDDVTELLLAISDKLDPELAQIRDLSRSRDGPFVSSCLENLVLALRDVQGTALEHLTAVQRLMHVMDQGQDAPEAMTVGG